MSTRPARWLIGAVVAGACSPAVFATEATTMEQMSQELAALRAEVRELRGSQSDNWLNERRAEEVKSLVREVLADADTRASLLEGGLTAGHDKGKFFLASEDGGFLMNIGGQIQVRYIYNSRELGDDANGDEDDAAGGLDEGEAGFQIRRAKVYFAGHIGSPKLEYAIQLAVSRTDNSVESDKIVIGYKLTDDLKIWAGEDKAPFLREEMISSSRQLAVERSLVNEIFTLDKVQGVGLIYSGDMINAHVMINDGGKSGDGGTSQYLEDFLEDPRDNTNKDFQDDAVDFAVTARVEVKLAGDWKQMADFTSWPGEELGIFLGAAVHWEEGETGDTYLNHETLAYTVDASVEYQGLSAFIAFVGASIENNATGAEDADPWGLVIQGAYNIDMGNKESLEPFVRFEFLDVDDFITDDNGDEINDLTIWTFGVNYYWAKHNAKLTLDAVWAQDSLNNVPAVSDSLGLLQDSPGEDDQLALRAQFQLLF